MVTTPSAFAGRRTLLQRVVGRGFADPEPVDNDVRVIRDHPAHRTGNGTIGVFLPTVVSRLRDDTSQCRLARMLSEQAKSVIARHQPSLYVFLAMQYFDSTPVDAEQAIDRLAGLLLHELSDCSAAVGVLGMTLRGPGKIHSINALTALARQKGVSAVILIDDDVTFSESCFGELIAAYRKMPSPAAVGARKIGRPFPNACSIALHRLKSFTRPAENYPHACCMLVSIDVISPAIPPIYSSDDGYVCFRLLDPSLPDPLARLRLIDGAICYHRVGGDSRKEITARIRRMLLHHHLLLSHFEPDKSRFYLKHLLFRGLWPFVPFSRSDGLRAGVIKCLLKYLYAAWFVAIGVELSARGILRRPIRDIQWGSAARHDFGTPDNASRTDRGSPHRPGKTTRRKPASRLSNKPGVLVVMPHYRCEDFIALATRSVLVQSHERVALYIVDDASPTNDWIDALGELRRDPRVRLYRTTRNVGPYRIKNWCIRRCDADFVAFQDADDYSNPRRLEALLAASLRRNLEVVGSSYWIVDERGAVLGRRTMPARFRLLFRLRPFFAQLHATTLVRRSVFERIGPFDGTTHIGADTDFLHRAAAACRIGNLRQPLYYYRQRAGSLTSAEATGHGSTAREAYCRILRERYRSDQAAAARFVDSDTEFAVDAVS